MTGKRAVIYARVSTDEQAKGYSLDTQIEECGNYAQEKGFEIIGGRYFDRKMKRLVDIPNENTLKWPCFADDFTGTTPIELRPEGRKAYALLASGESDTLIAYRIDRIVRPPEEGDEWDMPILIRGLAKLGRDIHTVNRGKLKTDFGSLLTTMLDAKGAGDERRAIVERTTRGRNRKAQEGKIVGGGKPPYGYRIKHERINGTGKITNTWLEIDNTEAAIVRLIYDLYINGEDKILRPLTDYAIARTLERMGIVPPSATSKSVKRKVRAAGAWSDATVRKILMNEAYAGVMRYGKTGSYKKGVKREVKPIDKLFTANVAQIVNRSTWEAAQARREHNKRISGKKRYLLRGIIYCGCGRKMAGNLCRGDHYRYRCNSNFTFRPGVDDNQIDCHEKTIKGAVIEAVVWGYVVNILTDPVQFEAEWRKAQQVEQNTLFPKRARLEVVQELIAHCEQEAAETAEALKHARGLVLANLQMSMDSIDERYTKLASERDRLNADVRAGSHLNDEALARAMRFRADIVGGLKDPTFDDKRLYLELLQVKIVIRNGKATISCILPTEPDEIDVSGHGLTCVLHQ